MIISASIPATFRITLHPMREARSLIRVFGPPNSAIECVHAVDEMVFKHLSKMTVVDTTTNGIHHDGESDRLSLLVPRIVRIDGRRTSVKLEEEIWTALHRVADRQHLSVNELVTIIDRNRLTHNLTSAVRAYVVGYLTAALDRANVT